MCSHQLEEIYSARSWLFTSATRPDRLPKAAAAGADVVITDLEDAIAPSEKDDARRTAIEYLSSKGAARPAWALRINGLGTRAGLADMAALLDAIAEPEFVILPKTESGGQLIMLDRWLQDARKTTRLVALVESARGLAAVDEIASATRRLAAVMIGAADLSADLGAETAWEPLLHARSLTIAACARNDVLALDSPYFDIRDADGLEREIARSRALGFSAKAAIHPGQVAPINAAHTPSPKMIAEAHAILAESAKGVGVINGRMIDEAVARKARRTLAAVRTAA
jgi:(S)-citramalyl-CoA lyase